MALHNSEDYKIKQNIKKVVKDILIEIYKNLFKFKINKIKIINN